MASVKNLLNPVCVHDRCADGGPPGRRADGGPLKRILLIDALVDKGRLLDKELLQTRLLDKE